MRKKVKVKAGDIVYHFFGTSTVKPRLLLCVILETSPDEVRSLFLEISRGSSKLGMGAYPWGPDHFLSAGDVHIPWNRP